MALLITKELAEQYGACGRGIKLLEQYPEGFTVDDVYSGKVTNFPMLHIAWTLSVFPYSDEERNKVLDYLKIKNSSSHYCSWDLDNCAFMQHSSHCIDSTAVSNSSDVSNSNDVEYSTDVNDSCYVYSSHFIYNCAHIGRSSNIDTSLYTFKSKKIDHGYGIHNSTNLTNAICCDDCHNGSWLMFCRGLNDANNRILCDENAVGDYCIANQEVSEQLFKKVWVRLEDIVLKDRYYYTLDFTKPDWSKVAPSLVIWTNMFNAKGNLIIDALPSLTHSQYEFLYKLIPSAIFII